jgi:transcriptional regulator with XRE-family HTH domain
VTKQPNPIDQHVGARVRLRRVMLGLSQEKLGKALGLTFQQVQKYEKGTNRIGASRLQDISSFLDVPPSYFFEGLPNPPRAVSAGFADDRPRTLLPDLVTTAEGLQLNRAFARIGNAKIRKRIVDLVIQIAESEASNNADPPRELMG